MPSPVFTGDPPRPLFIPGGGGVVPALADDPCLCCDETPLQNYGCCSGFERLRFMVEISGVVYDNRLGTTCDWGQNDPFNGVWITDYLGDLCTVCTDVGTVAIPCVTNASDAAVSVFGGLQVEGLDGNFEYWMFGGVQWKWNLPDFFGGPAVTPDTACGNTCQVAIAHGVDRVPFDAVRPPDGNRPCPSQGTVITNTFADVRPPSCSSGNPIFDGVWLGGAKITVTLMG